MLCWETREDKIFILASAALEKPSFPFLGFVGGGVAGPRRGRGREPESCSGIDFGLGFQTQPQQSGSGIRLLLLRARPIRLS